MLAELRHCDAALCTGRMGVNTWQQQAEALLNQAREAMGWARSAGMADLAQALATALLTRLPAPLHDERLQLADACEAGLRHSADDEAAAHRLARSLAEEGIGADATQRWHGVGRRLGDGEVAALAF